MQDEIIVHVFGEVDIDLVEAVSLAVEEKFSIRSAIGQRFLVPAQSYSRERDQYRSTEFLNVLTGHDGTRIKLGITNVDLFVPELNFVFGEASETLHVAVFSTARLDPLVHGELENDAVLIRRATSEAVHELGHVFGLGHCDRPRCVMWFSNMLSETDRKGTEFCQRCAKLLRSSLTQ
ncbi:MAG: archaemetzincin family Zn-dependent metalloprotease [Pyrinomonadaceae bacterium]